MEVFDERRRKRGERRTYRDGDDGGDGNGAKAREDRYKTELTQLKSALQKRNRKIAALKSGNDVSDGSDTEEKNSDDVGDDAGNAFGGKREKQRAKACD